MERGYVRVYTGDGKGKTLMALGMAMRVAGEGRKVFFGQFIKDDPHGDVAALRRSIPGVVAVQFGCGTGCIAGRGPDSRDRECAQRGLARARAALESGGFGLVVLDEITIPMYFGLITEEEVRELAGLRADSCELVLTGRYAPEFLKEAADIFTVVDSPRLPEEVPER